MGVRDRFRDLRDRVGSGESTDDVQRDATEALENERERQENVDTQDYEDAVEREVAEETAASIEEEQADTDDVASVPDKLEDAVETAKDAGQTADEAIGQVTGDPEPTDEAVARANRNLSGRREAAAENRVRVASNADVDEAVARANRTLAGRRESLSENMRRARQQARRQARQRDTGVLGDVGLGGVVRGTRETVEEGVTLRVDEVAVPGTAARVPIPQQRVELSGAGLRSASEDVREATGLPSGPPTGDSGRDDVVGELREFEAGEQQFQQRTEQNIVETVERTQRRAAAQDDLAGRSPFAVAPISPTPVSAAFRTGAATVSTASGGTTGGGGGATAAAQSAEVAEALGIASAAAAAGTASSQQSSPLRDVLDESELPTPTEQPTPRNEFDVPEDGSVTAQELGLPEDAFARDDVSVPDELVRESGELQVPDDADRLVLESRQVTGELDDELDEDPTQPEEDVTIQVPEEFIPDEDVTIGDEPQPDEPEVVDEPVREPAVDEQQVTEPQVQVDEDPLTESDAETTTPDLEPDSQQLTETVTEPSVDADQRVGVFADVRPDTILNTRQVTTPNVTVETDTDLDIGSDVQTTPGTVELTAPQLQTVQQDVFGDPTIPEYTTPPGFGDPTAEPPGFATGSPGTPTPTGGRTFFQPEPLDEELFGRVSDSDAETFASGIADVDDLFGDSDPFGDDQSTLFES